jgi:two-component sensor histidine kinase
LPEDFDMRKTDSLGMQIIRLLTEQIKGKLSITSKPQQSTTFSFDF